MRNPFNRCHCCGAPFDLDLPTTSGSVIQLDFDANAVRYRLIVLQQVQWGDVRVDEWYFVDRASYGSEPIPRSSIASARRAGSGKVVFDAARAM